MEKRLVKIIKEEVNDFLKTLDSHLEDSKERLDTKIKSLKKTVGSIPSDKSEEKRFKNAERMDAEEELKDVEGMEKDMEDREKELKKIEDQKKSASDNSNIVNAPITQTTITGGIS